MHTKATDSIAEMLKEIGATFRYRDVIMGTGNPKNVYAISKVVENQEVYHVCFFDLDGKFDGRYLGRIPLSFLRTLEHNDTILVDVDVPNESNCDWIHIRVYANDRGVKTYRTPIRNPSDNSKSVQIANVIGTTVSQTVLKSDLEKEEKKLVEIAAKSFYNKMVIETRLARDEQLKTLADLLGVKYVSE
ncbi:hypothetical protein OPFAMLBM_00256 [Aeromonas phage avDM12-TAAL]|nr:hypothetical protein OPFAMLBM_00256 [Aeromonas phage avDM12-TAAL]